MPSSFLVKRCYGIHLLHKVVDVSTCYAKRILEIIEII